MKKILFVADSLNCGGAEKSLINLLNKLNLRNVELDLMLMSRGGYLEKYLENNLVNIINKPITTNIFKKLKGKFLYSLSLRIIGYRHNKIHTAELHWKTSRCSFVSPKKEYDVAIAYHQGLPTYYVADKVRAKKKIAWINTDLKSAGYSASFNSRYYNKFNEVIVASKFLKNIINSDLFVSENKLSVLYDIVEEHEIKHLAIPTSTNTKDLNSPLLLCTVGRMEPIKNYTLAVNTAKSLKDKGLKFIWYFVGDGSEKNLIGQLIKKLNLEDYIILTGYQENPYPFIRNCDIYVQTSLFEGYSLTIKEARVLGRPIVTTNFEVVYDQIKDGSNGLIAEMNPSSLSSKIELLATDAGLRNRLSSASSLDVTLENEETLKKVSELLMG